MTNNRVYDIKIAIERLKKYCSIQDRCQQDVIKKIKHWGLTKNSQDYILEILIQESYIDELRYAKSFCRGKFNIKKWGRLKIKKHLMAKGISNRCIEIGISEIDENDYSKTLSDLISKYHLRNGSKNRYQLVKYFSNKGFEKDLIFQILEEKE